LAELSWIGHAVGSGDRLYTAVKRSSQTCWVQHP